MKIKKVLMKTILASFLALNLNTAIAGIPVIDGGNLAQNIIGVLESINQTLKQIEEYETQLQQYEKPKNYECSDYYSITDTKIKAELEQRCPRLGGNFTPSESKGGMLEF